MPKLIGCSRLGYGVVLDLETNEETRIEIPECLSSYDCDSNAFGDLPCAETDVMVRDDFGLLPKRLELRQMAQKRGVRRFLIVESDPCALTWALHHHPMEFEEGEIVVVVMGWLLTSFVYNSGELRFRAYYGNFDVKYAKKRFLEAFSSLAEVTLILLPSNDVVLEWLLTATNAPPKRQISLEYEQESELLFLLYAKILAGVEKSTLVQSYAYWGPRLGISFSANDRKILLDLSDHGTELPFTFESDWLRCEHGACAFLDFYSHDPNKTVPLPVGSEAKLVVTVDECAIPWLRVQLKERVAALAVGPSHWQLAVNGEKDFASQDGITLTEALTESKLNVVRVLFSPGASEQRRQLILDSIEAAGVQTQLVDEEMALLTGIAMEKRCYIGFQFTLFRFDATSFPISQFELSAGLRRTATSQVAYDRGSTPKQVSAALKVEMEKLEEQADCKTRFMVFTDSAELFADAIENRTPTAQELVSVCDVFDVTEESEWAYLCAIGATFL